MLRAVSPPNGSTTLAISTYPFILPSSGSVAVTTGAILLTTALDVTYGSAYMHFPANTFTGSAAGFYYVVMSSTTAGTMYSDLYTGGVPATPASPTLVTTGAGAYTQVTTDATGQSITIPANTMGINGRLYSEWCVTTNTTAGTKTLKINFDGSSCGQTTSTTAGANMYAASITNKGVTNAQTALSTNPAITNVTARAVDTTLDKAVSYVYKVAVATDWIAHQGMYLSLERI